MSEHDPQQPNPVASTPVPEARLTAHQQERTLVGKMELLSEVARVDIQREMAGQVTVRRERRVREKTLTIELVSEVLIIETRAGNPTVQLHGVDLPVGESLEIEVYQEDAEVVKKVVRSEEVHIYKERKTEHRVLPVELAYEELVVEPVKDPTRP